MASIYTYEQFEKAARDSGMYDQFSTADLNLAKTNPDAGMSILKYKQDYASATTDEARALANAGAEGVRSSYGNYQGGGDGGSFHLEPISPGSFSYESAPTYDNPYESSQPVYTNRYDETIQESLDKVLNFEDFSYDAETDPLYSQYRKAYTREGQRATADALGAAAAASGGLPSSYAMTAAAQAGNYYASQMTDKIPELYQLAYNKYLNDYNRRLSDLSAAQGVEQSDYQKYLNELNQYNTNRDFDYQQYLTDLNQYNADRSFAYGQHIDEVNDQTNARTEELQKALYAAEYGDYSFLNDMGINTDNNPTEWDRQYNLALLAAEFGDYSGLQALGINTSNIGGSDGATGDDGMTDDDDATTEPLTEDDIEQIEATYGGKTLTRAQWNALLSVNPDITETALKNAGFKIQSYDDDVIRRMISKAVETREVGGSVDAEAVLKIMEDAGCDPESLKGQAVLDEYEKRIADLYSNDEFNPNKRGLLGLLNGDDPET